MRKYLLLSGALLLGLGVFASAQVNVVPSVGTISAVVKQNTYSAVSIGLVPASAATDIFCISGSATRSIGIKQITISGTAGTLVSLPLTLLHRAKLDTGGTAATTTALPVAFPLFSTEPAATATLTAYTANPTINDSSPGYVRTSVLSLNTTSALVSPAPLLWYAGEQLALFARSIDIPAGATTEQYCVNANAVSVSSGVVNIDILWVEG